MSKRHFSILLVLVSIAVLAVALLLPQQTGRETVELEQGLLLPELGDRVNEATEVMVRRGTTRVTLRREEQGWVIAELDAYPADWGKLRSLLADVAQAKIVEAKTDNPAYYQRLGVEDPASDGATGALLRVRLADGEVSLVVGKGSVFRIRLPLSTT